MIEMRWKMGRANKGSPAVPMRLQYRYMLVTFGPHWAMHASPQFQADTPSPQWSEWMNVSQQFAAGSDAKSFDGTVKRIEADYEAATGKDKK